MIAVLSFLIVSINAVGQLLLKLSVANSEVKSKKLVVMLSAYSCFAIVIVLTTYIMQFVTLGYINIILVCHFIAATLVGVVFFKEKMSRDNLLGLLLILLGMLLYKPI